MVPVNSIWKKLLNVHTTTAAFPNKEILSVILQRTDSSCWTALDLSGQDKSPRDFEGITCTDLFHIQLSLSTVILVLKKHAEEPVTYTSHPINDQQTGCSHTHKQSLADYQISLFVMSLPFHRLWMDENCNYLTGPSSDLDGNKRNLYGSLMST